MRRGCAARTTDASTGRGIYYVHELNRAFTVPLRGSASGGRLPPEGAYQTRPASVATPAGMISTTLTLTARWVFPVAGPPLERGAVTVAGERILAVGPHGSRSADVDLGNAAVLPGLVNAHTHLDLSGLRGRLPPGPDFTAWLRGVIAYRRGLAPEQVEANMRAGLAESVRHGTTLLGDISGMGLSWPALAEGPIRAVVFHEVLGLPKERARQAWATARAWVRAHPATTTCRPGLSPHAPYSVRRSLLRAAALLTARDGLPLAIHLAETRAELELLEQRQGPFVAFLQEVGAWDPGGLAKGPQEVIRRTAGPGNVLFAHGNYLGPSALPPETTIVYCPRTHAAFGHAPHPFRAFLACGVRVALGTDSLASNPDLDVLAEARLLHRLYPDLGGDVILRMATLAGAEALGWADETGSLEAGKSADLVVVPLPEQENDDPHTLVFGNAFPVCGVMVRGQWMHCD